ncbi:MAG: hypothetical protein KBT07_02640 [Clostridiales bacterium]|nr:hypothetical protein [Candidatus Scatonaster coprocaballi]
MENVKKVCEYILFIMLIVMITAMVVMLRLQSKRQDHDYVTIHSAQDLYDEFYRCVYSFEPCMYVKTDSYEEFNDYWQQLSDSYTIHSVFREGNGQYRYRETNKGCYVDFTIYYNACGQAMQYLYAKNVDEYPSGKAQNVGEQLLSIKESLITDDMDDVEKVKKIHDYIVSSYRYNVRGEGYECWTAETLLNTGAATCQGYSEAFTALCLLSGVECRVVTGTSTSGSSSEGHAWTQVKISSNWYHVDVTWDDPIPDTPGMVRYDYFMKSDLALEYTHTWSEYFEKCYMDYAS